MRRWAFFIARIVAAITLLLIAYLTEGSPVSYVALGIVLTIAGGQGSQRTLLGNYGSSYDPRCGVPLGIRS